MSKNNKVFHSEAVKKERNNERQDPRAALEALFTKDKEQKDED